MVAFPSFAFRDDVWKKADRLTGSPFHISEDVIRRAKDSRTELRRFLREVKANDPTTEYRCNHHDVAIFLIQQAG